MTKVTMTVRFPETARDAAVLMVDQMRNALHLGHLVTSKPEYEDAKWSWMRRAEDVLAKAEAGERSPEMPVSANAETCWLIERSLGGAPIYYGKDDEVDALGWTKDHAKAIRYARRDDAQMQIEDIGWTEARPVEHQWG